MCISFYSHSNHFEADWTVILSKFPVKSLLTANALAGFILVLSHYIRHQLAKLNCHNYLQVSSCFVFAGQQFFPDSNIWEKFALDQHIRDKPCQSQWQLQLLSSELTTESHSSSQIEHKGRLKKTVKWMTLIIFLWDSTTLWR